MRLLLALSLLLPLAGCVPENPAGRIAVLILLPMAFIGLLLWAIRRGRRQGDEGGPPRGPDYDGRD